MMQPTASRFAIIDDPPAEMNGSGTPNTGANPSTTAMFANAWPTSQASVAPVAALVNGSVVCPTIRRNAIVSATNSTMSRPRPSRPVSSPMIAAMKSLSASGSHPHFDAELPIPTPKIPPDASAHVAWVVCQQVPSTSWAQPDVQAPSRSTRDPRVTASSRNAPAASTAVPTSIRLRTPAKNMPPSTIRPMTRQVPRSCPAATAPIAIAAMKATGSRPTPSRPAGRLAKNAPSMSTRPNFRNSDGCTETPPSTIQFWLPFTSRPSGVSAVASCTTTVAANTIGATRSQNPRRSIVASPSAATPTASATACLVKSVYGFPVACEASTAEAESTITAPNAARNSAMVPSSTASGPASAPSALAPAAVRRTSVVGRRTGSLDAGLMSRIPSSSAVIRRFRRPP